MIHKYLAGERGVAIEANEAHGATALMSAAIMRWGKGRLLCCERDGACNLGDEHDDIICGGRCPCAQKSLEIFRILRKPRIGTGRQGRAVKVAVGKDNLSMHEEIKQNHEQTFLAFDKRVLGLEACVSSEPIGGDRKRSLRGGPQHDA